MPLDSKFDADLVDTELLAAELLDADQRAAFLALLPDLADGASIDTVVRWAAPLRAALLYEIGARPGFDQVRAGLVRLAPHLWSGVALADALTRADAAVQSFPEDVEQGDPTLLLARHPAWVGLCALELAAAKSPDAAIDPDALDRDALEPALSLASVGFAKLGGPVDAGDVLWAMSEQAEESGWTNRSRTLLLEAVERPFSDPAHAIQARLVLGLQLAETGEHDDDAVTALGLVATLGQPGDRHRTHARWVLAAIARRRGQVAQAQSWLADALAEIDADEEPEIVAKLTEALAVAGDA